ncbi:NAD(+) diphosphatase [Paracoccaceae bacterium Fryx2]|nr:NAD(+) diphosphatase [Paracoccaceae bacterium Fryx2]
MRQAETVTFGGSGLERAAEARDDAARMAALWQSGRVLALWRGKPLSISTAGAVTGLAWLAPGNPALAGGAAPLFLGLDGGTACFAVDISHWEPGLGEGTEPQGFFDPTEQRHPALPADHAFAELRGMMLALTPREAELAATARALAQWHAAHGFCAACGAASAVAKAGWQRACPACGAQHFPRTDPVVIMLVTRGNRLLLGRSPGWPEGMYSCLAGFVEPGESVEAAVRREVFEETGVRVGAVRYLASQPWPFPASLMLGCLGQAETEAITLDPVELEDALWLTREELVQVFAGAHPRVKPARKGAIAHFLMANWLADRLD